MFVDELEQTDIAILDGPLSAERLELRTETAGTEPGAAEAESLRSRSAGPRGALSGLLLGMALWAIILAPFFRR